MLAFYASRLPTVEINNTFYRMPKTSVLESWASQVPAEFRFAIKASRRITHIARLKTESAAEPVGYLYRGLAALGEKRGPVLFQLPPNLKKDLPRLEAFLGLLPGDHRAAFEFRNDTWFADDVYAALKSRRRVAVPVRARGQRAAAAGRDGAVGLRPAAARNVFGRRSEGVGAAPRSHVVAADPRVFHARADGAGLRQGLDGVRFRLAATPAPPRRRGRHLHGDIFAGTCRIRRRPIDYRAEASVRRRDEENEMRFAVLVKATKESEAGVLPSTEMLTQMGKFNEELVKAGVMLAGEGLHPSSKGSRVRFSGGKPTVIDGPVRRNEGARRGLLDLEGQVEAGSARLAEARAVHERGGRGAADLRGRGLWRRFHAGAARAGRTAARRSRREAIASKHNFNRGAHDGPVCRRIRRSRPEEEPRRLQADVARRRASSGRSSARSSTSSASPTTSSRASTRRFRRP